MCRAAKGSLVYPLTEQIRDCIETHGLRWTVRYYRKRLTRYELRMFMRSAYLQ
jgi:hypothetical protein